MIAFDIGANIGDIDTTLHLDIIPSRKEKWE
jgi:hypothetical protein